MGYLIIWLMSLQAVASDKCGSLFDKLEKMSRLKAHIFISEAPYIARAIGMTEDDIAQELYVVAWRNRDKIDPTLNAEGFFGNKMNWYLTSLARKGSAVHRKVWKGVEDPEFILDTTSVEDKKSIGDIREFLKSLLKKIPTSRRALRRHFELYVDGISINKIAELEGIKPRRVRKNIAMIVQMLRASAGNKED